MKCDHCGKEAVCYGVLPYRMLPHVRDREEAHMSRLARLKELLASENAWSMEESEEVLAMLPGLIRVCDAYRALLISDMYPDNRDISYEEMKEIEAETGAKLVELLG